MPLYSSFRFYFFKILNVFKDILSNLKYRLKIIYDKKRISIKRIIIKKNDGEDIAGKVTINEDANGGDYLKKKIVTNDKNEGDIIIKNKVFFKKKGVDIKRITKNKGNIIIKNKVLFDEKGIDIQRIIRNKNNRKVIINAPTKTTCYLCGLELESPNFAMSGLTKCCGNFYHIHCCNENKIRQCFICKKNLKI